ncbi:MAG: transcriptional regulator [Pseudomonadota bacterium]|nr:transcriptional regulator [Desulfobacterales bacterium]MBU0699080.1 transcriptional regulator [Pseudomonadota bacterium]
MQTIRKEMIGLLEKEKMNAREISRAVRIREKEVYEHLGHIARSVNVKGQKLVTIPSQCLECGYVFKNRKRFSSPSRCPYCKSEQIRHPTYRICKFY